MEMTTRPIAAPSAFASHSSATPAPAHAHAPAIETPLPNVGSVAMTAPHSAFAGAPSLSTIAHEATHVVQQRGGAASPHAGMYEP